MKIYTLNDEGKRQVLDFVRIHANDRVLEALDNTRAAESWYAEVENETAAGYGEVGHWEMGGRYTKSGNPVTVTFGAECFDSEELPED